MNWRNGSHLQLGKQCERLAQEEPQWWPRLLQEFARTRCASPRFSGPWPWLSSIFCDSWNLASHKIFEGQRVDMSFLLTKRSTSSAWRWAALISWHWRCCFYLFWLHLDQNQCFCVSSLYLCLGIVVCYCCSPPRQNSSCKFSLCFRQHPLQKLWVLFNELLGAWPHL